MKNKYKISPSGKGIRSGPDKLYLALKTGLAMPDLNPFNFNMEFKEDSGQPNYATDNFDIRKLQGLEVTIFGAGSVGSYIAQHLGPAQLSINLIDSKRVEYKHTSTGRTAYDQTQIGMFKVDAAKQKLEANFIGTNINPLPYDVAEIPETELVRMCERSAIVILVIDDPSQIIRINSLVYKLTEIIQVGMTRQAKSGFIAISIPYVTPCIPCTLGITDQRDIRRLDSEPGAGIDISIVSQHASRVAMDLIYSKVTGNLPTKWDVNKNLILISNYKDETSPDGPGITHETSQKRPGCPICS